MSRLAGRARRAFAGCAAVALTAWALFLLLHSPDSPARSSGESAESFVQVRPEDAVVRPALAGANAEVPPSKAATQRLTPEDNPDAAGAIKGVVLDTESGEPIANARVFQRRAEVIVPFSAASETDQNGTFTLPGAGVPGSVVCQAHGYQQAVHPTSVDADELLTIYLARGSSIRGRVLDDLGAPVVRARVWAFLSANASAWPHGEEWLLATDDGQGGTTTTDSEGRFEISGLDPSKHVLVRAARPFYTSISSGDEVVTPGDNLREIQLQLVPVGELSLTIVDEETGYPVRHAVMAVGTPRGTAMRRPTFYSSLSGETGKQGKGTTLFRFLRSSPTEVAEKPVTRVRVSAHGYRTQAIEIPVRLGARSTHEIKLQRQPGLDFGRLRVRAEWQGGRPFSGPLAVMFWSPAYRGGQGVDLMFEDGLSVEEFFLPTGKYDVTSAGSGPVGRWWEDRGHIDSCLVTQNVDNKPSICRVTLRGAVLRIRVESPRGEPLRGYGLAIVSSSGHGGLRQHWHQEYRASRTGATLPDFAEVMIPRGRFTCYARMPDGRQSSAEVVAEEGGELLEASVVIR